MKLGECVPTLVIAVFSTVGLGCQAAVECGLGTAEVDGVCLVAEGPEPPPGCCGWGTYFDGQQLLCAPLYPPRVCDPLTTIEEVREDGVTVCIGHGVVGCGLLCPQPDPGKLTVCGTLYDAETSEKIAIPGADGALCESASQGGPCALELTFYDALQFSQNPGGAAPLPLDSLTVNECGEFVAENIPVPALGYIGLGIDDAPGASDLHVLSGVAAPAVGGDRIREFNAYAVRHTTDQAWTATALQPFGATTFSERGVVLMIYLDCEGNPVAGVRATASSSIWPGDDYYYADTDPLARSTVDVALEATGANGSALLVDQPLVDHGGDGGEPEGCRWPDALAKAIPGVVFVTERHAEDDGSATCCQ